MPRPGLCPVRARRIFADMECALPESLPRDWGIVPFVAVTGRPTEDAVRATVARVDAKGAGAFLVYARSGLEIECPL